MKIRKPLKFTKFKENRFDFQKLAKEVNSKIPEFYRFLRFNCDKTTIWTILAKWIKFEKVSWNFYKCSTKDQSIFPNIQNIKLTSFFPKNLPQSSYLNLFRSIYQAIKTIMVCHKRPPEFNLMQSYTQIISNCQMSQNDFSFSRISIWIFPLQLTFCWRATILREYLQ